MDGCDEWSSGGGVSEMINLLASSIAKWPAGMYGVAQLQVWISVPPTMEHMWEDAPRSRQM